MLIFLMKFILLSFFTSLLFFTFSVGAYNYTGPIEEISNPIKLQYNPFKGSISGQNIVDVENEVAKIKENKSNKEIEEIKKRVLNKKIEEKLSLFSRSHFSNLESSTLINFK